MSIYLCYDVKGIQSFIFKIPKLKYIIGGSALIDRFDGETIKNLTVSGSNYIFSGGGKGTFLCDSKDIADKLLETIKEEAHNIGLDIRFGMDEDFSKASINADVLYPYIPEMHDGKPCPVSGLYPVRENQKEHPIVHKRLYDRKHNEKIFRRFENKMLEDTSMLLPAIKKEDIDFFHNVSNDDGKDGRAGFEALGKRNRWAIIAMDGNDMGMQFRNKSQEYKNNLDSEELKNWIKEMSRAVDKCSTEAAKEGIREVVSLWAASKAGKEAIDSHPENMTLPIRPLVIGGDDIVVLCHSSYAMQFVEKAMLVFEETSKKLNKESKQELWPATNGKITISAGVLYSSVTLPLHTAIPYADSLLASAKNRGREINKGIENQPSPACIDWEQITDTIVDTPAQKRQRELIFKDKALDNEGIKSVQLTRRPYTIEEFSKLKSFSNKFKNKNKVSRTVLHKILPALQKGYADRLAFVAELKKSNEILYKTLSEWKDDINSSNWETKEGVRTTNVIDALILLEEENRMEMVGGEK